MSEEPQTVEDALVLALESKDKGNEQFKSGNVEAALDLWRAGVTTLETFNEENLGDVQVKALLSTVHTNLAMGHAKLSQWRGSCEAAAAALAIDPQHHKALFRRATARRELGELDGAKADLETLLALDPTLKEPARELVLVKRKAAEIREAEKKQFAGAFAKGSGLYADRADEAAAREKKKAADAAAAAMKKAEDERQAALLREADAAARKQKWEDHCVSVMSGGGASGDGGAGNVPSFEEWDVAEQAREAEAKAKKEEEEAKLKKEREAKAAAEAAVAKVGAAEKKKPPAPPKPKMPREDTTRAPSSSNNSNSSSSNGNGNDDTVPEGTGGALRGYKLNAEGRKTSYFNHDLDEEAKALIGDITPQKIDTSAYSGGSSAAAGGTSAAGASAWNAAGTWEERNLNGWCAARLAELFASGTPVPLNGVDEKVKVPSNDENDGSWRLEVSGALEEVTAEASVCVSRGKRRSLLEVSFTLPWRLAKQHADQKEIAVCGKVTFPDISGDALAPEDNFAAAFLEACTVTVGDEAPSDDSDSGSEGDKTSRTKAQTSAVNRLVRAGNAGLQQWVAERMRSLQAELANK